MRIVTDGVLYAIEKGWIFKKYRSIHGDYWWSYEESFKYCWGTKTEIKYLWYLLNRKRSFKTIKIEEM